MYSLPHKRCLLLLLFCFFSISNFPGMDDVELLSFMIASSGERKEGKKERKVGREREKKKGKKI